MNPVVLLDEVDKVGSDYRGDPAAALLEVLDPAQNHTFRDHYLEVELDLSDVGVPGDGKRRRHHPAGTAGPDGGRRARRLHRGREGRHRPRPPAAAGSSSGPACRPTRWPWRTAPCAPSRPSYTREAGVRAARARDRHGSCARSRPRWRRRPRPPRPVTVGADDVERLPRPAEVHARVGAAHAVARRGDRTGRDGAGGDVLFVEAATMDGEPGLTLTGQLGDVMKESAQIALSLPARPRRRLGVAIDALADQRVHVHFPAGAVPKDGPSAGVTMTTALASLLTGRLVRPEVGMTGEVSLTGRVLPIGGVKQKLLAAHRAGLTEVILAEAQRARTWTTCPRRCSPTDRAPGRRRRRGRTPRAARRRGGPGPRSQRGHADRTRPGRVGEGRVGEVGTAVPPSARDGSASRNRPGPWSSGTRTPPSDPNAVPGRLPRWPRILGATPARRPPALPRPGRPSGRAEPVDHVSEPLTGTSIAAAGSFRIRGRTQLRLSRRAPASSTPGPAGGRSVSRAFSGDLDAAAARLDRRSARPVATVPSWSPTVDATRSVAVSWSRPRSQTT